MAMSYTSLIADKGTSGSLANWVNYSRLDLPVIVDEAQALIYQFLRCREMRSLFSVSAALGSCRVGMPSGYLDPIGDMRAPSLNMTLKHRPAEEVIRGRSYEETSGTLGTDPFETTAGSGTVVVTLPGHGFNQGAKFSTSGASAVGGLTIVGTFIVQNGQLSSDTFSIDCSALGTASSSATGGGAAATYVCQNLLSAIPTTWSTFNDGVGERLHFDAAMVQAVSIELLYYRSLPLLSSTNQTNFLTDRYPNLMRSACQTAAADYMKDDPEYNKGLTRLQMLISRIQQADDLEYRGADIYTETPGW